MISEYAKTSVIPTSDKTTRRVLIHGPALMLVEFRFQQGGIGTPHRHEEHDQVGYVPKAVLRSRWTGKAVPPMSATLIMRREMFCMESLPWKRIRF